MELSPIIWDDDLFAISERLLTECADGDDVIHLASLLDTAPPEIRKELLHSDLLNAYQAFYYYFRVIPGEIEQERLILEPASALDKGVRIGEIDLLTLIARYLKDELIVSVSDGTEILKDFKGESAYDNAVEFINENL